MYNIIDGMWEKFVFPLDFMHSELVEGIIPVFQKPFRSKCFSVIEINVTIPHIAWFKLFHSVKNWP